MTTRFTDLSTMGTVDLGLMRLLDALIPGDGATWPPGSHVIAVPRQILRQLPGDREWIAGLCAAFARLPPEQHADALQAIELTNPEPFQRLSTAVCAAYYAAPEIAARTTGLTTPDFTWATLAPAKPAKGTAA